jgi:23S rRNA (uracil1939-C5)-methyltransferase
VITKVDCPHSVRCAGCPAIDLPLDAQLAKKRERLRRAMGRYASLASISIDDTVPADPITGYRTRAKLVAGRRGELGLFAKDEDHVVVDIPECRVLSPRLAEAAAAIRGRSIHALRAVDLRDTIDPDGNACVLVTLILDARRARERAYYEAIARELEAALGPSSIAASFQEGPQLLGRDLTVLRGAEPRDAVDETAWTFAAHGAFVQAHRSQAANIYARIRGALAAGLDLRDVRVADAYAGSGAIGLVLAKAGARVIAIESFAPAAERAARAAKEQGLPLEVVIGDAGEVLERSSGLDAIVLDPPRRGLTPELRLALGRLEPSVLVMLSCEPETFARDLDHLARLGFGTDRATPLDLMPLSNEVEALAILERRPIVAPRVLFRDGTLLALEKSAHEPTTPQEGRVLSLLERARRTLPGLEHAVPLHRLDQGTSGVCLFALRPEDAGELAARMHGKRYLALARGITHAKGTIAKPLRIDGETLDALTKYKRIRVVHNHSLLAVRIETGRTHQIRRHLAMIGHPVLGDARYGHEASNRHFANKHFLDRPFLHAASVAVGELVIESELPGELASIVG